MADLIQALARWRVRLGFVCGAVAVGLAHPTGPSLAAGVAVALIGESLRIWAAGHLEKGREVTKSGPYSLVRHPLYLGSSIIGLGVCIAAARIVVAIIVLGYLGTTFSAAIRTEEAWMRQTFGDEYDTYLQAPVQPAARRFSLARARANREYRAVAGLVAVAAILALKALLAN